MQPKPSKIAFAPPRCKVEGTPHEVIYGKRPDMNHLRILGNRAYVYKPSKKRSGKFYSREIVGYCKVDAYRVQLDSTKKVDESKDVQFEETIESNDETQKESLIEFDTSKSEPLLDDPTVTMD